MQHAYEISMVFDLDVIHQKLIGLGKVMMLHNKKKFVDFGGLFCF